jgi:hypothetical protein
MQRHIEFPREKPPKKIYSQLVRMIASFVAYDSREFQKNKSRLEIIENEDVRGCPKWMRPKSGTSPTKLIHA